MKKVSAAGVLLLFFLTFSVAAETTVYIVRHGEKEKDLLNDNNPGLTKRGHEQARALAMFLQDARITAIYVSDLKRTQQTAEPVARLLGITPKIIATSKIESIASDLKQSGGNSLVIGHSETIPKLLKSLGIKTKVVIRPRDYDDLFIVTLHDPPILSQRKYP
jgi:phosphohistidine phosphatase SixA